jgi:membrane protein DedA with SNARE-associated domain
MLEWVQNVMQSMGYVGIALLAFLENLIPPIPSEAIIPAAGYASARGELTLFGVIVAATAGAVLGALPLYALGYWMGRRRLVDWANRYGAYLTVRGAEIERAVTWFERRGIAAVFLARVVPGVRSLISIPAGIARMNLPVFLVFTTLGSSLWTTLLAGLGFALGKNHTLLAGIIEPVSRAVLFGGATLFVVWVMWRWRRKVRTTTPD